MTSQQPERRVSFAEGHRVHVLSPRPSPEPDLEEQMPLPANGAWQAGIYGASTIHYVAPQFIMHGPPVQTTLPSFPIPPTPLLATVELPSSPSPSPSPALGSLGPALPLPASLGADELLPRGDLFLGLPIVWRLEQQWDVRDSGLPLGLPADEPVQALCGIPEVVLRFAPHPLFAQFGHTLAVEPDAEGKLVVTVGDLARAVQAVLRAPLEGTGRVSDEQRSVLREAQWYRRRGRAPVDCRVDMWGPGRMFLRHLVSLSSAEGGLSREFVVCFQLIP
ncbi:hypothetical protein V8D89_002836 [Ganoderma adspersum]